MFLLGTRKLILTALTFILATAVSGATRTERIDRTFDVKHNLPIDTSQRPQMCWEYNPNHFVSVFWFVKNRLEHKAAQNGRPARPQGAS